MIRASRVVWTFRVLSLALLLSACGRQVPATESNPQLMAVEQVSTPVPSVQETVRPMPTPIAGEPVATTQPPEEEVVTSQHPTPSPPDPTIAARLARATVPRTTAPAAQTLPDTFPIYPFLTPDLATPAGARSPQAYQQDVIEAVTTDLAHRLGVPVESVRLVSSGYLEVALASPCGAGTGKEAGDLSAGGLSLGFEVLLEAESAGHRYIGLGGLAYYCGPQ